MSKHTMKDMPLSREEISKVDTAMVREQLILINQRLNEIQLDVTFIKDFFVKKESKRARRREKKQQQRLEAERLQKAERARATYKEIVRELRRRPWELLPAPKIALSPKELEMASILSRNVTDAEVAKKMRIQEHSIAARISAINKKLGLKSRQDSVDHYLKHKQTFRTHRHKRCTIIVSWLLDPPPGLHKYETLRISWQRQIGKSKYFRFTGPYVPLKVFDSMREYERRALEMKAQGKENAEIASKLNIKEATLKTYFSEARNTLRWWAGVHITSNEELLEIYKNYLERVRRRNAKKNVSQKKT